MMLKLSKSRRALLEQAEHHFNFIKFILLDHLSESGAIHVKKGDAVVLNVLFQKLIKNPLH